MLPFLKHRDDGVQGPVETIKREPDEDKDLDMLDAVAEDLLLAVQQKSTALIKDALSALVDHIQEQDVAQDQVQMAEPAFEPEPEPMYAEGGSVGEDQLVELKDSVSDLLSFVKGKHQSYDQQISMLKNTIRALMARLDTKEEAKEDKSEPDS